MATIKLKAGEAMAKVMLDVRITGVRTARFRLWLAAQIMKLAGLVAGTEIRVEAASEFDQVSPLPRFRSYMALGDYQIPRQCSIREGSPFYEDSWKAWGPEVDFYLDGVRQDQVISYDLDSGYMRVFRQDEDGQPLLIGDDIATEIKHGKIEVRLIEREK